MAPPRPSGCAAGPSSPFPVADGRTVPWGDRFFSFQNFFYSVRQMGASEDDEEGGGIGVDATVGTIVWVRRRNGSWWPGRILGQDELSASHLMSPRSGTPVKLLGREDASVDWYNLEKSKRVKAFRCGEFDACIEKAEASQGAPIKKREKYARRVDAILHALELEKKMLDKQPIIPTTSSSKQPVVSRKEMKSETGVVNHLPAYKGYNSNQLKQEDDTSETAPRMRGLRDFGLRTTPLKRKSSLSVGFDSFQSSFPLDNTRHGFPESRDVAEGANLVGTSKTSFPIKGKRSLGSLAEDSFSKKRDRRRPLVQVLQNSAKLSGSQSSPFNSDMNPSNILEEADLVNASYNAKRHKDIYLSTTSSDFYGHSGYILDQMPTSPLQYSYSGSIGEHTSSGFLEANESESSETESDSMHPDSEDNDSLSAGFSQSLYQRSRSVVKHGGTESLALSSSIPRKHAGVDDVLIPRHISSDFPCGNTRSNSTDVGVSNWHMKRKRNIRLTKRAMEAMDGKNTKAFMNGRPYESKNASISRERALFGGFYSKLDEFDESEDLPSGQHGSSRYSFLKGVPKYFKGSAASDSEDDTEHFGQYYSGYPGGRMESVLIDVDLKVQASSHGERVPLVSLMSRLDGKAIIGHPVQIEKMEDGSIENLLYRAYSTKDRAIDENASLSFWRMSRGASLNHVPRPTTKIKLPEPHRYSPENTSAFKKKYPQQVGLVKKSSHQKAKSGSHQKKSSKKPSTSNQKTRTLSSFAAELKSGSQNIDGRHSRKDGSILSGLIKSEDTVPIVTCLPVKVVFSRLLEAVGRPPATHRGSLIGSTEEKPS